MFLKGKSEVQVEKEVFVIYDSKIGVYREPSLAINQFDILRQIESLLRDSNHRSSQLFTNAEDFQLFKIGSWDSKTGQITSCTPHHVANLHEIKAMVVQQLSRRPEPDMSVASIGSQSSN